jgi:cell wall-associated NlpC family hydrolase
MSIKVSNLLLAGAGGIFLWSAIAGKSITSVFREIIGGNSPTSASNANTIQYGYGSGTTGGTASGSAISQDALQYVGEGYIYGGPSQPGKWDCSSFVSYVLGHDLGHSLPGGTWTQVTNNGSSHGPSTLSYLPWTGASSIARSSVAAGDLLMWQTHIGIAISNTQMVSALNQSLGTQISSISGPTGEVLFPKRLN